MDIEKNNETIFECAIRETKEEIGIDIEFENDRPDQDNEAKEK